MDGFLTYICRPLAQTACASLRVALTVTQQRARLLRLARQSGCTNEDGAPWLALTTRGVGERSARQRK